MTTQSNADLVAATEAIFGGNKPAEGETIPTGATARAVPMNEIKDIELSNSLIDQLVDFGARVNEGKTSTSKPKATMQPAPAPVVEEVDTLNVEEELVEKVNTLILKLSSLLKEAKATIVEMTSAGMIGSNQKFTLKPATPLKKKKKTHGPRKAY